MHGERSGFGHGDHGHHPTLRRFAREFPRRRRERERRASRRSFQDFDRRPESSSHLGEHFRRHHEVRRHRRRHRRRGQASRSQSPAHRAIRGNERRGWEQDSQVVRDDHRHRRRPRRRRAKSVRQSLRALSRCNLQSNARRVT